MSKPACNPPSKTVDPQTGRITYGDPMTPDKTLEESKARLRLFVSLARESNFSTDGLGCHARNSDIADAVDVLLSAAQQREVDFRDSQIEMLQTQLRTERERVKRLGFALEEQDERWGLYGQVSKDALKEFKALSHSGKEGV